MSRHRFAHVILSVTFLLGACQGNAPAAASTPQASDTPVPVVIPSTAFNSPQPTPVPPRNPCKLPEAVFRGDVGLGFPRYKSRMQSIGTVRATVLFVDFSDAQAEASPQDVYSMISPGASDFFRAVSYGRMIFELEPHLVWLRMSRPSTDYGLSNFTYSRQVAYIQEAVDLADAEVDFSGVQAVYVMANPLAKVVTFGPPLTGSPDFGSGVTADGNTLYNGATSGADLPEWKFLWLNHEVGHTMGLVDLYGFYYDVNNYNDQHRFVGNFSLMGSVGGAAPEPLAYERWLLDWLDDDQIVCQESGDQTITLTAIEKAGGIKAVIVPTGRTTAVVVESRRAMGYDVELKKPGVLLYIVDTAIDSGSGVVKVVPVIDGDPLRDKSPLAAGESYTVDGVTITVLESAGEGDTVHVTVSK